MSIFTKEQIWEARNADLPEYFRRKGYSLTPDGSRYYVKEFKGLVLKNCTYWDFYGSNEGKNNAVDCLVSFLGMDFYDAVADLLGVCASQKSNKIVSSANKSKHKRANLKDSRATSKTFVMPQPNADQCRVIAYLHKTRMIPMSLITYLISNKLLFQDKLGNCVFPWDYKNSYVGAEIVGTVSNVRFKKIQRGSKPGYGFVLPYPFELVSVENVFYFESVIDLLSYIAINGFVDHSLYISMGGLKGTIIDTFIDAYPKALHFLCCDIDARAFRFVASLLPNKRFSLILPPLLKRNNKPIDLKDWNEVLVYQFVYDYIKSKNFRAEYLKMDLDVTGFEEYQRNILQLKPDELVEWYFVAVLDIELHEDDDEPY